MDKAIEQFRDAIQAAGMTPPDVIEPGKFHRFPGDGKANGSSAGWCKLFTDGNGGIFGDHSTGLSENWHANGKKAFSDIERKANNRQVAEARKQAEDDHTEARERASLTWAEARPCVNHPYLSRKNIGAHGTRLLGDLLVLPLLDGAELLHSLQFILPDGGKKFLTGGRVRGCYFAIGNLKAAVALCICEGFATGASIHEATGHPVVVAFNAGNLLSVARAMREHFSSLPIILAADDDAATEGNPGITKATEAARSVGGLLAVPDFGTDRADGLTDFNDMAAACGSDAVKRAIANARTPAMGESQPSNGSAPAGDSGAWPEPQPLAAKVAPEPYPLDALPDTIRAAVEEVASFVKAPLPMVASSALAALSLATQAHIDVRRDEILSGPVGLFLLTIAESGERKSQADKMFTKPILDYQDAEAESAKPILKDHKAALYAWEAKRGGIKDKIRQLAKDNKPTASHESDLRNLEHDKPEPPRVPKLIREDATPEGLAKKLQKEWPSAGVVSNEAGIVFGAHGMGADSVMRNLALLNKLWDGGRYQSDRGDEERSRDVRGARLTMGLMIQETTLRAFFDQSKGLARGTGFLARFFVAWPESRMGTRFYTPPVAGSPALSKFNRRITELLNQPVPIDEDGILTPPMLILARDAKVAWVAFHDAIESELASGGELYDVRDVASKSADNAVRLAALFQIFEHGMGGAVGLECFESASLIAAWHLNESRRFLGELALPAELADAGRLDSWLLAHCKQGKTHFVGKNHVRQHGPLRDGARLDAAIRELAELDRLRLVKDGKRLTIQMNPVLVGVTP